MYKVPMKGNTGCVYYGPSFTQDSWLINTYETVGDFYNSLEVQRCIGSTEETLKKKKKRNLIWLELKLTLRVLGNLRRLKESMELELLYIRGNLWEFLSRNPSVTYTQMLSTSYSTLNKKNRKPHSEVLKCRTLVSQEDTSSLFTDK